MQWTWTAAGLWVGVVGSGLYHGVNPGMGWPMAVSAGLMERSSRALGTALCLLMIGHGLAMLVVMLPFALLVSLFEWERILQFCASLLLIGVGTLKLARSRHPRVLTRIPPSQLGLWSFVVAIAHGAGLMLLPIYIGLCRTAASDPEQLRPFLGGDIGLAMLVSFIHSAAMIIGGGALAFLVFRFLGLKFIAHSWFNLDAVWASSLILAGSLSLAVALSRT